MRQQRITLEPATPTRQAPRSESLYALFDPAARGGAPLVTLPDGRIFSHTDADAAAARFAGALAALGLGPGDRLTVQAPKSVDYLWLYLACLRSGIVFHPLNDGYTPGELAFFLGDAEPAAIICGPDNLAVFAELAGGRPVRTLADIAAATAPPAAPVTLDGDAPAALLYSSGTTGTPKGAVISHRNLAANARALVSAWGFSAEDRLLHALPLYHAHGLFVAVGCAMAAGASLVLLPRFDPDAVLAALPGASVMMGVPTFYTRLLAHPGLDRDTCRGVRLFVSGSAPLGARTFAAFEARTGHRILERYGLTETGMNTSNPLDGERRPGSVGLPLPGVEVRITGQDGAVLPAGETGGVEVRGDNVFAGYWRAPDRSAEAFTGDGWFITGDLGRFDADGYLHLVGRSKDLVITGGLNVYPAEVERVLDALPGITESAVIGVPHPDFGEGLVAVVAGDESAAGGEAGVIAAARERLAAYRTPKRVLFTAALPRNTMGKVRKNVLRKQHRDLFADEGEAHD